MTKQTTWSPLSGPSGRGDSPKILACFAIRQWTGPTGTLRAGLYFRTMASSSLSSPTAGKKKRNFQLARTQCHTLQSSLDVFFRVTECECTEFRRKILFTLIRPSDLYRVIFDLRNSARGHVAVWNLLWHSQSFVRLVCQLSTLARSFFASFPSQKRQEPQHSSAKIASHASCPNEGLSRYAILLRAQCHPCFSNARVASATNSITFSTGT